VGDSIASLVRIAIILAGTAIAILAARVRGA
jgi:hypothetical protein